MFDMNPEASGRGQLAGTDLPPVSRGFTQAKRAFDLVLVAFILAPMGIVAGLGLLVLNPWLNRGPLFYSQTRMGRDCQPFRAWKFRSMTAAGAETRGAFDRLEHHRITPLGRLLRRSRIDELPQVINVLRGEMSLIGPRPDYFPHAQTYLDMVPGYRERHAVLPGISGYAQIEHGYIDGPEGVRAKVDADLHYIRNVSFGFDLWIAWRTFMTVVLHRGL